MQYSVSAIEPWAISFGEPDRVLSVLQDIKMLLAIRQGEAPLYRDFGLPQRFLDMPANVGIPVMIAEVEDAMAEFLPDVRLIEVIAEFEDEVLGRLYPVVKVEINHE